MSLFLDKGRSVPLLALLLVILLVTTTAHGQTPRQLTRAQGDDDEPCFSPDGKWIVYQSRDTSGRPDLWIVGLDGSAPKKITSGPGYKCFPTWSPDGKKIVFSSDPAADWVPDNQKLSMGRYDLYAIDLHHGKWSSPKQLTNTPLVVEYLPTYSPDGKQIAFSCGMPTGYSIGIGDLAISVMSAQGESARTAQPEGNLEGTATAFQVVGRQLVSSEQGAIEPTWSRDGKTIAFAWSYFWQIEYHQQMTLCMISSSAEKTNAKDTQQLKQLAGFPCYSPAFSPTADLLAFALSKGDAWDIWILSAPYTGEPMRLTDHPANDVNPAWSPDGKQIAFASNRNGSYNIYIIDVPQTILTINTQK